MVRANASVRPCRFQLREQVDRLARAAGTKPKTMAVVKERTRVKNSMRAFKRPSPWDAVRKLSGRSGMELNNSKHKKATRIATPPPAKNSTAVSIRR